MVFQEISASTGVIPKRKFEYKLSFKGPHLVQRDGTIPFWQHGGFAIASDESIRITPSLRSKKGHVWSKNTNPHDHWEVEIVFRVSGRGRVGADGLAVWYTAEVGSEGPVFGSNDQWKGLGVFFDSFDNDGQHNNPYIMAMNNDGTVAYDHNSDGNQQQLGGCLRDFRNKPYAVRAKIEYLNNALTLYINNGMTGNDDAYELCMRKEGVYLPKNGYFGVTAATGGLADDHDVQSFLTHSLKVMDASEATGGQQVSEDERKKFEQEFDEYYEKLQKAKEEFRKEHPEKQVEEDQEDKYFEDQGARELKQIFEGQNVISTHVRDLHRKLDEVIGRQERTLSQISLMGQQTGSVQQQQQGGSQGGQQLPIVDTIKRFEVDSMLANQRELINSMREFRNIINTVHATTTNLQHAGGAQGGTYQDNELKSFINAVQSDIKLLLNKPQVTGPVCPPVTGSCITPFYFFLFAILQVVMVIGYAVYRNNKEAAAKKFY